MQSVSTILSKDLNVIDITFVVSAQTSFFTFTVQTSCKSVYSIIYQSYRRVKLERVHVIKCIPAVGKRKTVKAQLVSTIKQEDTR